MPKKRSDEIDAKVQLFVKAFTDPSSPTFNNTRQSMIAAGYTKNYATGQATKYRTRPDVAAEIEKARNLYLKPLLEDGFQKVLQTKLEILNRDLNDYYKTTTFKDENGQEHEIQVMIPLDELTPELRKQIMDIEYKGSRGVPGYQFLSKEAAMNDIIKLHEKFCAVQEKAEDKGIEITLEGIKDKVTAKVKVIEQKQKQAEIADDYKEDPLEVTEEL